MKYILLSHLRVGVERAVNERPIDFYILYIILIHTRQTER
jgi:hypothetical protein